MSKKTIEKYLKLIKNKPEQIKGSDLQIITDNTILLDYEKSNNCELGVLANNKFNIFVRDLVKDINGNIFTYDRIIKPNDRNSVVIIAKYKDTFVLLKQYRHAMQGDQLAFPRGYGEPDLSITENAQKEIIEELGCKTKSVKHIGCTIADSGICGETVNICLCEIDKPTEKKNYECIKEMHLLSLEEIYQHILEGKINDGYTLSALTLYSFSK